MDYEQILKKIKEDSLFFKSNKLIDVFHLNETESLNFIKYFKNKKRIQTLYKIKTEERFENFDNDWTPHLQELCKVFKTRKGELIDGSEINNLEFMFKILDS